jgi:hypothetical protein
VTFAFFSSDGPAESSRTVVGLIHVEPEVADMYRCEAFADRPIRDALVAYRGPRRSRLQALVRVDADR